MRMINNIVIHCAATPADATIESIERYWREVNKWKSPGYHYIIRANGSFRRLATHDQITNGVARHNQDSIHVCYIGGVINGVPYDTRTPGQKETMKYVVSLLLDIFPGARVLGHRNFAGVAKACPSFDAVQWAKDNKFPTIS